ERVAVELASEQVVAVDDWAAGGREAIGHGKIVETGERFTFWKDGGRAGIDGDLLFHGRWREVRVAAEVIVVERVVPHRVRIVAAEPVAPVVALATELRIPAHRVEIACVGADAQIAP